RASRLLDAIAAHDEPVSLKILASATDLHPSTAFRILASLIEHRFVERSESGRYQLGIKLLQLGSRARGPRDPRREVHPPWDARTETTAPGGCDGDGAIANAREPH
ncbi:helix-turn-helix domain-containing protein, partial [Arthrospira platensis SPKY1]|nr:helix-turn-helix domain-containing protein [Arthrospira platensis SPKY1]